MEIKGKKLYKSRDNKVIFGVFGGLGEFFEMDPVLFRVGFIVLAMFMAFVPGVIAYIFMALIMPEKPENVYTEAHEKKDFSTKSDTQESQTESENTH